MEGRAGFGRHLESQFCYPSQWELLGNEIPMSEGRPDFRKNPEQTLMPQLLKERKCPGLQLLRTDCLRLWSTAEVSPRGLALTYSAHLRTQSFQDTGGKPERKKKKYWHIPWLTRTLLPGSIFLLCPNMAKKARNSFRPLFCKGTNPTFEGPILMT